MSSRQNRIDGIIDIAFVSIVGLVIASCMVLNANKTDRVMNSMTSEKYDAMQFKVMKPEHTEGE